MFTRAMAIDPAARYPGPGELIEDCLAVLDGGRAQNATGRLRRKLMFFGWGDRKPGAPGLVEKPVNANDALTPKAKPGMPGMPGMPGSPTPLVVPGRPAAAAPAPAVPTDDDPFPE